MSEFLFKFQIWRKKPETAFIMGFIITILIGSFFLCLPVSSAKGEKIPYITALFTSTSAVCVTGLTVEDTGTYFSFFGQVVILILIQVGGLGIMTLTATVLWFIKNKVSIQNHLTLEDTFVMNSEKTELKRLLIFIFILTFLIEFNGTAILFIEFCKTMPLKKALYNSIFHSISAFCNAGFSLFPDSLMSFHKSILVMSIIMLLIIIGGIGYPVFYELRDLVKKRSENKFSLHFKIVVTTTIILIIGGMFLIKLTDHNIPWLDALFQSVTSRTAGFNSYDISALSSAALLIIMMLMFIGGSPGSCAGGIKTTTFTGMLLIWRSWFTGAADKMIFKRRLPDETLAKIKRVWLLFVLCIFVSFFILLHTEGSIQNNEKFAFRNILFEVISASGTVGLSTGITPKFSIGGKMILIFDMFMGRVGPLAISVSLLFLKKPGGVKISYSDEKIMVG